MAHKWSKLKNAEFGNSGKYLKPGYRYKLKFLKMFTFETRNKGEALIVDFEILESNCPSIPVGDKRNWYQKMSTDNAMGNIKELLFNLFGIDQENDQIVSEFEENLEAIMDECADERWQKKKDGEHPLFGKMVAVETEEKITKEEKVFTVHRWEIVPDQD